MKNNFLGILFFSVLCVQLGCQKEEKIVRPVATIKVLHEEKNLKITYPAFVESLNSSVLSFKVAGQVKAFNYELGAFVKKGQIIASLDDTDYETLLKASYEKKMAVKNAYIATKAQADNARKQFARAKALYNEKALAKKKFDEAQAMYESAIAKEKASLAQFKEAEQGYINKHKQKEDTKLLAPFDGYIAKQFTDIGAVVSQGMPVLYFASKGKTKVQLSIAEKDISILEHAEKILFLYKDKEYQMQLQTLGKVKQSLDLVYPAILYFTEDNELLSGTEGEVVVFYSAPKTDVVSIPATSVMKEGATIFVWCVENNKITPKTVNIVKPLNNGDLLVRGLALGDTVVIKGVHELYKGQQVVLLEEFSSSNVGEIL